MLDTLWSPWAELKIELGLGLSGDSVFTLDDPVDGQLDHALLGSPDSPYADVTCDVRALEWGSGATRADGLLTRWESGTASITLGNELGLYDPTQPGARLQPMVLVRIRGRLTGAANWLPLFQGYADEWSMAWDENEDSTVTVTATDGTKLLSRYDAPETDPPVGAGETAAQRATRILDSANWQGPRRVTAGGTLRAATSMADDAWSQLLLNQDAELGDTFVDKDGALVFNPRSVWLTNAIIPDDIPTKWGPDDLRYEDAHVVNDDTNLRNIVDAAHTGGTAITARDESSVAKYLPHRYGRMDLPFTNAADDYNWANLVLVTSAWPAARVDGLEVLPQASPAELFPIILNTNYGDRWGITVDAPGMTAPIYRPVQVRGWRHSVDGTQWRVTYALVEAVDIHPFTLDDPSAYGTLDVMRLV